MKKIVLPTSELTVDTVMRRWPATIRVFLDFGMHCVGCPIATFHSVNDACREHAIELAVFLEALQTVAVAVQVSRSAAADRDCPSASPNNA